MSLFLLSDTFESKQIAQRPNVMGYIRTSVIIHLLSMYLLKSASIISHSAVSTAKNQLTQLLQLLLLTH